MRPSILCQLALCSVALFACGGDGPSQPTPTKIRGLRIVAGADVSDTVSAMPSQALVVDVHDSTGAVVPAGTVVQFSTTIRPPSNVPEMLIKGLASSLFGPLATGTTDTAGRAAVIVRLGTIAGTGRIAISVPAFGLADTARYTVAPGATARVTIAPADTLVYVGSSFSYRGNDVDRYGNARSDPITWAFSSPGAGVSSSGAVTAVSLGRYTITATAGLITGTASITVVPRGRLAAWRAGSIAIVDVDGSNARSLAPTDDGGIGVHPRWMPGGAAIVYTTLVNEIQTLRVVDTNGVAKLFFPTGIPNVTHQADPSPTEDGKWLYFGAHDSRCSITFYCLYRSRIDGSAPELLGTATTSSDELRLSPSPDGSRIAFLVGTSLQVFDVATKTFTRLSMNGTSPAWSPDGTQIAFLSTVDSRLSLIKPDGTGLRVLTAIQTFSDVPMSWSRDGRLLLARAANGEWAFVDTQDGTVVSLPWTLPILAMSIR